MIRLNRILAAIATWINALLWWREGEVSSPPFTLIRSQRFEGRGMIYYVRRSELLCPRDVGTAYFVPLRLDARALEDLHICIDHLEGMARSPRGHTHQVSVMRASHWPDRDGRYAYTEIYCTTADLQGLQMRRDIHVSCVLAQMVAILKSASPEEVNWPEQVAISIKTCMGSMSTAPSANRPRTVRGRIID